MFEKFIEWTEKEHTRARKIMLFSVVFVFLIISLVVLILVVYKIPIDTYLGYYGVLAGLAGTAIGFYTGTNADSDAPQKC
jgi:polyferredoxin